MNNDTSKKRDHDDDRGTPRPRAWRRMKDAIGGIFNIRNLMQQLETLAGNGAVRPYLAAAIHHFLTMDERERSDAITAFYRWHDAECDREHLAGMLTTPPAPVPLDAPDSITYAGFTFRVREQRGLPRDACLDLDTQELLINPRVPSYRRPRLIARMLRTLDSLAQMGREVLPDEEMDALAEDFNAAVAKIMGEEGGCDHA